MFEIKYLLQCYCNTSDMLVDKYGCHTAHKSHSHSAKWKYRSNNFTYMCQNTTKCNVYLTCYCHVCASNIYAPQMPHMQISICADMSQLCQYIGLIAAKCNQQCDQDHWYTHISHYWHMPMNTHIIYVPLQCYCSLHIDPTLLHI